MSAVASGSVETTRLHTSLKALPVLLWLRWYPSSESFYRYKTLDVINQKVRGPTSRPEYFASDMSSLFLVYNQLFRALATEGRDAEFLSLWTEARNRTTPNRNPLNQW
jgi:hypothetical protein